MGVERGAERAVARRSRIAHQAHHFGRLVAERLQRDGRFGDGILRHAGTRAGRGPKIGQTIAKLDKGARWVACSLAALYAATLVVLRASYASRPLILPYGHHPGWDLLRYNVTRWTTWKHLLVTLNVLPLLSVLSYRSWPVTLKVMVWSIVPAWFVVHFLGAIAAETRLFLVPASTVFVPGALFWFRESGRSQLQTASRMAQSRADHST